VKPILYGPILYYVCSSSDLSVQSSTGTRARLGLDLSAAKVILRPAVECAELHSLYFLFPNQICLAIPDGFDHCIRGKTESVHRHSREHVNPTYYANNKFAILPRCCNAFDTISVSSAALLRAANDDARFLSHDFVAACWRWNPHARKFPDICLFVPRRPATMKGAQAAGAINVGTLRIVDQGTASNCAGLRAPIDESATMRVRLERCLSDFRRCEPQAEADWEASAHLPVRAHLLLKHSTSRSSS
jgi:hypothetical protein